MTYWPSFQQGYFTYPQVSRHDSPELPPHQPNLVQVPNQGASVIPEEENYSYYLRLINPKKKSDL